MSSNETEAYKILRQLDVDYVLVIFGGMSGYSSDDINKFLWMVRIGGGVFPVIKEADYLANVSGVRACVCVCQWICCDWGCFQGAGATAQKEEAGKGDLGM